MTQRRQHGFTYLSLMILLAIIGLVTASSIKLGSVLQRSRAEQELLEIGAAFSDALQSYAEATPAGQATMPPSLKELLRDPRFPTLKRHLRKIFVDPVTGRAEWGIVYAGEHTGVLAVYSLSTARPVKISNFPQRFASFAGVSRISDWKFTAGQMSASPAPAGETNSPPVAPAVAPSPQSSEEKPESAAPAPEVIGRARENEESPAQDEPPVPVAERNFTPFKQDFS
ncbi:type II secretion system protein [Duganella qianjiadongensis]|nr:type II secretion system protein [Duganella qianjiadongensis]